jgi:NAD(P)H-dependent FMN reductase
MYNLMIITGSTRDGRKGQVFSPWISGIARADPDWRVTEVDLAEVNLPLFDEPEHPRLKHYHHEHTKRWSETVSKADAYVLITPEYNFSAPPSVINAFDYVLHEWAYKPIGFVSYGGVSGGTRSVQMIKQLVTTLRMVPIFEAVSVPFFVNFIKDGRLEPNDIMQNAAGAMLKELKKWTGPLKDMREAG